MNNVISSQIWIIIVIVIIIIRLHNSLIVVTYTVSNFHGPGSFPPSLQILISLGGMLYAIHISIVFPAFFVFFLPVAIQQLLQLCLSFPFVLRVQTTLVFVHSHSLLLRSFLSFLLFPHFFFFTCSSLTQCQMRIRILFLALLCSQMSLFFVQVLLSRAILRSRKLLSVLVTSRVAVLLNIQKTSI